MFGVFGPGQLVDGRFRLVRLLGEGGMGQVYWARHELLERDVALKLVPGGDQEAESRFVLEAKIISRFRHPNIVEVVDAGRLPEGPFLFLAMELLGGMTFADWAPPGRPLPPEDAVRVLVEVCRGLEVAHAAGVVHRDIKPENIFLAIVPGIGVVPKILDFGISCASQGGARAITVDGTVLGTPAYMSPEQASGARRIDCRADLWAVGVMLHEALSGRLPFIADTPIRMMHAIVERDPEPLPSSVPEPLRRLVARCLDKNPEGRPPSAGALREELERFLPHGSRLTPTGLAPYVPTASRRELPPARERTTRPPPRMRLTPLPAQPSPEPADALPRSMRPTLRAAPSPVRLARRPRPSKSFSNACYFLVGLVAMLLGGAFLARSGRLNHLFPPPSPPAPGAAAPAEDHAVARAAAP